MVAVPKPQPTLTALSPELLRSILDHLERRKSWMRSLLVTSRHSYHLVLPRLYNTIQWTFNTFHLDYEHDGKEVNYQLLQMLDEENQGLKHVRTLILRDDHGDTDYQDVADLIYRLPKDTLRDFQWISWTFLPYNIYRTLLIRQRSLIRLDLVHSQDSIDTVVQHGPSTLIHLAENLERLRFSPGRHEFDSKAVRQLLQQSPKLRRLKLDFVRLDQGDNERTDMRCGSSYALYSLFSSLPPSSISLRSLSLSGVYLRQSRQDGMLALDFSFLEKLQICRCHHAGDFLDVFCQVAQTSMINLKAFEIYHAQTYVEDPESATKPIDPLLAAINTFLERIPPLQNLLICLRGFDKLPDVASVAKHGTSLRRLFIDVRKAKGPLVVTYPMQEWQLLCTSLQNLHQLDMTFPVMRADCKGSYTFGLYIQPTQCLNSKPSESTTGPILPAHTTKSSISSPPASPSSPSAHTDTT
ncbi:MAG: hypothetical protein Q9169_003335 [Polycauliona sp. 2 TL-2023]